MYQYKAKASVTDRCLVLKASALALNTSDSQLIASDSGSKQRNKTSQAANKRLYFVLFDRPLESIFEP